MLTEKDINLLKSVFVTREEFEERISQLPTKDEFHTRMDEVMGQLKSMQEEMTLTSGRESETTDTIEEHEGRIVALEGLNQL